MTSVMSSNEVAMAASLANVSSVEINQNRELLKQAISFYSANVKNYAKWFEISEVNKNEETFTSYKVVYRFLPKDLNESIKQVVVWKRFRDFKELNQFMSNHHAALHRRDKFPEFIKSKFFGRFDDKVIEERRQYSLRLLQFIGSQSHLYKTDKFIEFFSTEGATFTDYQTSESITGRVLQPTLSPTTTLKRSSESSSTSNHLSALIADIGSFIDSNCPSSNPNSYDYVIDNLVKTRKLLSLSAAAATTQSTKSSNTNINYNNNNNGSSVSLSSSSSSSSAADKYLKSALNNLSDFMAEMDIVASGEVSSERKNFLKSVYRRINSLMEESLLARQKTATVTSPMDVTSGKSAQNSTTASPEANFLNDWILSDFNLVSNDFNSELSFISGNLFDLSFNYKLVKLVNEKCFLMKLRHAVNDSATTNNNGTNSNHNEYFFLKRLQKSFNPTLTSKSLVPFKNRIPFMCQLLKYYESESTIFLLIEYHKYGSLYPHLLRLIRHSIHSYPENLPQLHSFLSTSSSLATHSAFHAVSIDNNKAAMSLSITNVIEPESSKQQRNVVSGPHRRIRLSRSFSGFSSAQFGSSSSSSLLLLDNVPKSSHVPKESPSPATGAADQVTDKRRAQSHSHSVKLTMLTPVEIPPQGEKVLFSSSSMSPPSDSAASMSLSSSSSSSGLDSADPSILVHNSNNINKPNEQQESSKIEFSSGGSSRVVFKATTMTNSTVSPTCTTDEETTGRHHKKSASVVKQESSPTVSKYQKQVKLWLAQVLCALRNLHEMGIVCKDLTSDDLVLSQSGDLLLTYISKWNLVEETVKRKAIDEFYSAPELSGMVNNPIGEACDWWSFGIIAYELISAQKFASFHERHEIYVDKITFPSDFKCDLGKDLIRKLLRLNPAMRLTREQIQQHAYFQDTDWISLEESFWKSSK